MEITISVAGEVEGAPARKAAAHGCDVAEYVERLIERDVNQAQTLDEILAPFRRDLAESGMTEDELEALIEGERQAMREERRGERSLPE